MSEPKNRCLVLMAHGSRDPKWREPFELLKDRIADALDCSSVALAYMEFASPTLDEVIENKVNAGTTDFIIFPLFMAAGAHVSNDIPAQVEKAKEQFDGISITVTPPVGEAEAVKTLMVELAVQHYNQP